MTLNRTLLAGLLLLPGSLLAAAQNPAAEEAPSRAADPEAFAACLDRIGDQARSSGVSDPVVRDVLSQVRYVERVIELDRRQPEFTSTFADYLGRRVTDQRVARGRELLAEHEELLERVHARTGVQPHYLVAFWGLETNFGSYFGKMSVPDSLATLACDQRRSKFFTSELIAALRIIDAGDIDLAGMEGSWAGAMGHMQFMPSVFLRHAVDADGDGRRDLWGSIDDAMNSAGTFLAAMNWKPGWRWGREVRLPEGFDHGLAGRRHARPLADWAALGVTDIRGRPLPSLDEEAAVLVPSGHEGPAFVVYHDFDVIMGWNRSEYYALAVGLLADRIAGTGRLSVPPPDDAPPLSRERIRALQQALIDAGFDPGGTDGIFGPATRGALREWQTARGMIADGHPDRELFRALGVELESASG
ncbi:MAG: lytic murein transglycosylase [Gammaproteobacteria bacterium]|nr:lytic murein transglycosylase [Gammaproteobacteria bacterium]